MAYSDNKEKYDIKTAGERACQNGLDHSLNLSYELFKNQRIIALLESIADAFYLLDKQWRIVYVNSQAARLIGRRRETILGKVYWHVFPETLENIVSEKLNYALNNRKAISFEDFVASKGIWIETNAYPSDDGLMIFFRDITERKMSEEKLRLSEERFSKSFNANPCPMAIINIDEFFIVDVNDSFLSFTGYMREDVIGRMWTDLLKLPVNEEMVEATRKLDEEGMFQGLEISIRTKSGKLCTGLIGATRLNINGNNCLLATYVDITERKGLEKEVLRLDRLNLIEQMAAGLGDGIRNHIATVHGFLQMLKDKPENRKDEQLYKIMIENLDKAGDILTEYLSLAKNTSAILKPQNINRIIESIAPVITVDARKKGIEARFVLGGGIMDLPLNEWEIQHLVLNLARNSIEAMTAGDIMTIETSGTNKEVVLTVQDQGEGISVDLLNKLGIPFLTTKEEGKGLGLAVCYAIAHRNNATINVETSRSGTTFFVRFRK